MFKKVFQLMSVAAVFGAVGLFVAAAEIQIPLNNADVASNKNGSVQNGEIVAGASASGIINTGNKWSAEIQESKLMMKNGQVEVNGKLAFVSDGKEWKIIPPRDDAANRYALADPNNNVQGYLTLISDGETIKLLFYHRTAQNFYGTLSLNGEIHFYKDGFACQTQPRINEKVLPLQTGNADSLQNDSLFSPENDTVLRLTSARRQIRRLADGHYAFSMSGRIEEAAESQFVFHLQSDYFKKSYVPYYHTINRKRVPKTPTGWMSWNTYFDKATAEDNLNEAKIGKQYLQPFGCEIWSIESWQGNSDELPVSKFYNMNLEVNEKQFPDGMKKLADDIRALGFRPGIWIPPFGTGNTEFYETHKDWFLHNENGQPIVSWNGKYMLDPTVAEAREHLKKMFRTASSEWGYEFFKIDGMSGNTIYTYEKPEVRARFYDPSCPNPFELCLQAYREGIGEDRIFLACMGHTSGVEVRYADASRLGADIVAANQPVKWANVMNQGRCTINQIFTHNIVLIADPDTLLVHDLPIEEARTSATIVALPGQLTFFGDKLAGLSKEQMKILQQTLPVADVRPAALYPHFSMLPIWNLSVRHEKLGSYNVVALFNWNDLPQTIDVSMNDLGLPASSENHWLGYEFWTQKPVKINNNLLSMNVPPHSVRVVVIQPNRNIPQWAGSDRHIAQNGIELLDYQWNAQEKTLRGKIQLVGNFPLTARLHIPENYRFTAAAANIPQRPIVQNEPNNILAVTFQSEQSVAADFEIKFHEE